MLQFIVFSVITTTSAFTTHRYDSYDSFGNYRPSPEVLDNIFGYDNSNGRRPVQVYEYAKRYDGVVISDVYDGGRDGGNRRIDTPYSYENPHQWNRQVPWIRVAATEPAKFVREYPYNPDTRNRQPVVLPAEEEAVNQIKQTNGLNKTQGNAPQINTQSDDVNNTLVITEQQITWNNDHQGSSEGNANITTRSINTDNETNSLNVPDKPNADKIYRPTKSNIGTANINNRDKNDTANNSNYYRTKTTGDNEVTPGTQEPRTKAYEDDRWIWSNGQDQVVETTTLLYVDDRAAFSGDGCPVGKVKFGNMCIAKD